MSPMSAHPPLPPIPQRFTRGFALDIDPGKETNEWFDLERSIEDANDVLIGYGMVSLGEIKLIHDSVPKTPKSGDALARLEESFEAHGVLRYSNPIILVVNPDQLDQKLDTVPGIEVPLATFTSPDGIICLSGEVRERGILRRVARAEAALAALRRADPHGALDFGSEFQAIQGERLWLGAFYDKSECDMLFGCLSGFLIRHQTIH